MVDARHRPDAAVLTDLVRELTGETVIASPSPFTTAPVAPVRAPALLRRLAPPSGTVVVVDVPLSTALASRVMGWSSWRRGTAAVSEDGLDGEPERVAHLVAHEAGHVLGLRHCRRRECTMHRVDAAHELDSQTGFCTRCRSRLRRRRHRRVASGE